MKTTIDKNESEFDRMKRQSFEWLEKHYSAPPFLHLALREFKSATDEQAGREKEPDINTPFFGNSGAKVPLRDEEEKPVIIDELKQIEEIKDKIVFELENGWSDWDCFVSFVEMHGISRYKLDEIVTKLTYEYVQSITK